MSILILGFSKHEFRVKEQTMKTGKKAGTKRYLVTLCIYPYTFRRKKDATEIGNTALFSCTGCEHLGHSTIAHGILQDLDENNQPEYQLSLEPL